MRHDVCNKQRLYDEYLEELHEACLALLTELPTITVGRELTVEEQRQRVARPMVLSVPVPQFTITVNVEL